jgi:hypothetical protein
MYTTLETRWFFEGDLPGNIINFYDNTSQIQTSFNTRTDYYLKTNDSKGPGIKIRDGNIEIKHITKSLGVMDITNKISGVVQEWRKWSYGLANNPLPHLINHYNSWWIGIKKSRKLRKFCFSNNQIHEKAMGDTCKSGCEWEISSIQSEQTGKNWWSMAFEAFGNEKHLKNALLQTVIFVLNDKSIKGLIDKNSASYPEWIHQI